MSSEWHCDCCIHNKYGKLYEDEEHVKTFLSNNNQAGIAWLLWDIRKIRLNLDMEC